MSRKNVPTDVLEQAQDVLTAWTQISTTLAFGTLNATSLSGDISAATALDAEITRLEKQLVDRRNMREVMYLSLWDKVKRTRAGIKASYGDDSPQFELIGGTRMSDRKPPTRKTPSA